MFVGLIARMCEILSVLIQVRFSFLLDGWKKRKIPRGV
jgi:hypothetical protein